MAHWPDNDICTQHPVNRTATGACSLCTALLVTVTTLYRRLTIHYHPSGITCLLHHHHHISVYQNKSMKAWVIYIELARIEHLTPKFFDTFFLVLNIGDSNDLDFCTTRLQISPKLSLQLKKKTFLVIYLQPYTAIILRRK